ncbi:MAG TPA: methyltransferase domain-containing protein, partial [Gaiellaceae bacterium]|nr:methyltransferase domain-containing protein [Gaiellaceae bacterium]
MSDLVCPSCASDLFSAECDNNPVLICTACRTWYPVVAGIPVMLTFITPFHEQFAASHSAELGALGATLPAGHPRTGEESTQATFTAEWEHATNSDLSFIFDGNDLVALNREVWLAGLHDTPPRTILDVGCGAGQEAIALGRVFPQAQISAVDLNFSMLTRVGELAESETPVDFAVASLFALPFPDASFDLVYSEGVLHHTYSTREAFNAIALKVAEGGHLFVWLYGRDDLGSLRGRRR